HLTGHLLPHHLGEQLPARHLVAVADEPGGEHALGVGFSLRQPGEQDVGHAQALSRSCTEASIRSGVGSTACSSDRAYGIGTSGTATRRSGARSRPGAVSATRAGISPDSPNDWESSSTIGSTPVLATEDSTVSVSSGTRLRRSITSRSTPSCFAILSA